VVVGTAPLAIVGSHDHAGVRLDQSLAYLAMAPLARVLDELSLLEAGQHIAFAASLLCLTAILGVVRAARPATGRARTARGLAPLAAGLLALVATYAFGALVPRPMVALVVSDSSTVVVDFHSHTRESHDGRWNFTAQDNRDWHAEAGFHAAYVTDHQTMKAWSTLADQGALASPETAEATVIPWWSRSVVRTTLLPGVETHVPGLHINILGVGAEHESLLRDRREVDTLGLALLPNHSEGPLVLATLPFDTARIAIQSRYIDAIELSDASPRGLEFGRVHRARILAIADSLGLPVVASSNNHGWGRTAAAWTLVRIAGWREREPLALDTAIRVTLRTNPGAVSLVERNRLNGSMQLAALALTLPRLAIHVLRSLSPLERVSWLLWIWLIHFAWSRRRAHSGRRLVPGRILRPWTSDSKAR
jgi:hypothetical protein